MTALPGLATPPPIMLPAAYSPAASPSFTPPSFTPPPPIAGTPRPSQVIVRPPVWTPPRRVPTPGQVSGTVAEPSRLARGSIPPDFTDDLDLESDTDPGVPVVAEPEPVVQRGARFSVVRSSRR
jgi:hypothetical protein